MNPALTTLLAFLAAVLAVAGVYSVLADLTRDRSRVSRRVDEALRNRQRDRVRKSELFRNLGQATTELEGGAESREGLRPWLDKLLEQSGLQLTLRQLGLYMAVGAAVVGTLAMALGSTVLLGLLALPAGAGGPLLYVAYRRNKRLEKMRAQLPDTYDLMARIIRSGQTMSQALQAVADEFEPPVATEFAYCFEQQNLGLSSELALRDLARRTSLVEIKIFVLGLLVQQQTGGNLAELLEKLALVIRARFRIRGKIKTLTAEGRLQAIVLLALPFVVFLLMLVLNWDYTALLLEHPGILAGTFLSEVVGAVWIRKIVNFDY